MSATMTANPNATQNIIIRAIEKRDNAGIARVIREVSAEHGLTADKGFAVADPILDTLFEVYHQPRSAYWVVEMDAKLLVVVVSHLLRVAMGRLVNYRKCISLLSYEEKELRKKLFSNLLSLVSNKALVAAT